VASHTKVLNLTTGCRIKRSQAVNRIEQCTSEWVETGFSIRDLTLAESIQFRSNQARLRAPLSSPELPGLRYAPPATENTHTFLNNRRSLITQAREFVGATQ
jgi:hypothetical protein